MGQKKYIFLYHLSLQRKSLIITPIPRRHSFPERFPEHRNHLTSPGILTLNCTAVNPSQDPPVSQAANKTKNHTRLPCVVFYNNKHCTYYEILIVLIMNAIIVQYISLRLILILKTFLRCLLRQIPTHNVQCIA